MGSAAYIHMASRYEKSDFCSTVSEQSDDNIMFCLFVFILVTRSRIKMAFQTHYVGDLRSVGCICEDVISITDSDCLKVAHTPLR